MATNTEKAEMFTDSISYDDMTLQEVIELGYTTLFTREADAEGLAYWLESGISKEDMFEALINGADTTDANTLDAKYDAAVAAAAVVIGDTVELTVGHADLTGTADNDTFTADQAQTIFGGVVNTLSSASDIDGGAGTDTLNAEIVSEFNGADASDTTDIVPETKSIEIVTFDVKQDNDTVVVDAKEMTGVTSIGSLNSDGDLVIENLNTLNNDGEELNANNTNTMTITMDHTDNFNSDGDASDLTVLFDEDYFITNSSTSGAELIIKMTNTLNLKTGDNALEGFDAVSFTVGDTEVVTDISSATSYDDVVTLINAQLNSLNLTTVSAATAPLENAYFSIDLIVGTEDSTVYASQSLAGSYNPITVVNTGSEALTQGNFTLGNETIDGALTYTQTDTAANTTQNPLSVNVELFKVGREGEGGDLVVGGKELNSDDYTGTVSDAVACDENGDPIVDPSTNKGEGIPNFYISVKGTDSQDSNLGTITSTNAALDNVYITTDAAYLGTGDVADLVIRDGFNDNQTGDADGTTTDDAGLNNTEDHLDAADDHINTIANTVFTNDQNDNYDNGMDSLTLVDANGFQGDLTLGEDTSIYDLGTLKANGGGDVTLYAENTTASNTIDTGAGTDTINVEDMGNINISTGSSNDTVNILLGATASTNSVKMESGNDTLNVFNANNINTLSVDMGSGNDTVNGAGLDLLVNASSGDDAVYFNNLGTKASTAATLPTDGSIDGYSFLYGRTATITFSGDQGVLDADAESNTNGFEVTTAAIQANGEYNYLTSYSDLTKALQDAVASDAVLSKLISIADNGTITSLVDGDNNTAEIEISAVDWTDSETTRAQIETEYREANSDSTLVVPTTIDCTDNVVALVGGADCDATNNNNKYTLAITNAGQDVVALSVDHNSADTIVVDAAFGETQTIVNFTTGEDKIDYSNYLTSMMSTSGSEESARTIVETYGEDLNISANEVTVLQYGNGDNTAATGVTTFGSLSSTNLTDLFDLQTTNYADVGNYNDGDHTDLVSGNANSIVMVQNNHNEIDACGENTDNLGEYKVFYINYNAEAGTIEDITDTDVSYLGTFDFGADLNNNAVVNNLEYSFTNTDGAFAGSTESDTVVVDPVVDPAAQVAVALTDADEDTATTPNTIDASDENYIYTFDTTGNDSFKFTGFSEGDTLDINDDYTVIIDTTATGIEVGYYSATFDPAGSIKVDADADLIAATNAAADNDDKNKLKS